MKVIVIGAGMAGLTFTLACQRMGVKVKLYEKAKQLRNIGGGLLLWPHGRRYLEWLGLADGLKPYEVSVRGCRVVGTTGQEIFNEEYSAFYALVGGKILPIDRNHLQQALCAQLADNVLELNKQCVDIQVNEHSARVLFADGTEDSADIVVGADGVYSAVRKTFNQEPLQYTGYCWWGGIIEQKHAPNLLADEVFMAIGQGKTCMVWPTDNKRFMWYLPVKMAINDFSKENSFQQLQTICAGWNSEVDRIIAAPQSSKSFHLPIYSLSPQTHWFTSRAILIGDAAHALGPILGQGVGQAIEDAFVLTHCLQYFLQGNSKNVMDVFKHYETLRREKVQRLFELENQSSHTMVNDDLDELEIFQQRIRYLDLITIYHDLIPLVDEKACQTLATAVNFNLYKKAEISSVV